MKSENKYIDIVDKLIEIKDKAESHYQSIFELSLIGDKDAIKILPDVMYKYLQSTADVLYCE